MVSKRETWKTSSGKGGSWRTRACPGRDTALPDPQILWQARRAIRAGAASGGRRKTRRRVHHGLAVFPIPLLAPLAVWPAAPRSCSTIATSGAPCVRPTRWWRAVLPLVGEVLEEKLLRFAHAVTTATEAFAKILLRRFPFLRPSAGSPFPTATTGRHSGVAGPRDGRRLVVTYAGTIFRLHVRSPRSSGRVRRAAVTRDWPDRTWICFASWAASSETELPASKVPRRWVWNGSAICLTTP